jgi:spore coat protein U-like protein
MLERMRRAGLVGAVLAIAGAGLSAASARAQSCDASFAGVENLTFQSRSYDVYRTDDLTGNGEIRVVRTGDAPCQIAVALKSDSPGERELRGPAGALVYSIREDSANGITLANTDRPAANGTLKASLSDRDAVAFPLVLRLPAEQTVPAGQYNDTVTAYLYDLSNLRQLDRRTFTPSVRVDARADVSVSASTPGFDIASTFTTLDLGELRTGERAQAFVTVRSTSDYELSLASDNGARLRREGGGETIDYQASLDGSSVQLTKTARTVERGRGPTARDGRSYRLEVRIGSVDRKRAGTYSDRIRIRVEPLD